MRYNQDTKPVTGEKTRIFTSLAKTILLSFFLSFLIIILLGFHFGFGTYYTILCDKLVWHNPSYAELTTFIDQDTTDQHTYEGAYVCDKMSKDLIKHARERGYRAGYVYLDGGNVSHAIVCFETTDAGVYFVEPQADIVLTEHELQTMVDQGLYQVGNDQGHITFPLERYIIQWYKTTEEPPLQFWSN